MHGRFSVRRGVIAAAAVVGMVLSLAACTPDRSVPIDAPPQVEGALPAETQEQLEAAVANAMSAAGASGAIVGVWAPWSGSWVAGLGTQTPAGGGEVTTDMQFAAAKSTRSMTCDILYQIADQGLVELDDSITEYVAAVPDLEGITLGQLCDGTSGIGSYTSRLLGMWLDNPERRWGPRELAAFGLGQERTAEPGAQYRDSDAGYLLLGLALERATGKSARMLVEEYVADPLDLTATTFGAPDAEAPVLTGLFARQEGDRRNCLEPVDITDLSRTVGFTDAGVTTDITDLGRYAQALATGALVPAGERLEGALPESDSSASWLTVGGGVYQAGSLIGQHGVFPGYTTAAYSDPESGLTVAVVLNQSAGGSGFGARLAWELAAIASKAPAASGQTAPAAGLPWTPEQFHQEISDSAICAEPIS